MPLQRSRKRGCRREAAQVPKAYPIRHCHRAKFERLSRFPLHALQGFGDLETVWKRFVGSACVKSQCEAVELFSRGELAVLKNVSVSSREQAHAKKHICSRGFNSWESHSLYSAHLFPRFFVSLFRLSWSFLLVDMRQCESTIYEEVGPAIEVGCAGCTAGSSHWLIWLYSLDVCLK